MDETVKKLHLEEIKSVISIGEPMLLLDYAEVCPGSWAKGYKMIYESNEVFRGHYPNYPMLPGTYQIEALAQLFSLIYLIDTEKKSISRLTGFDKIRFYKEVKPDCKLELECELEYFRHGFAKGTGRAFVDGQYVSKIHITNMIT